MRVILNRLSFDSPYDLFSGKSQLSKVDYYNNITI